MKSASAEGGSFESMGDGGRPGDLQWFTTPDWLADRAWAMFKSKDVERLLDACAGTGAMADAFKRARDARYGIGRHHQTLEVDAVEIDGRHHPTLREKGYNVAGLDFLSFSGGAIYSHVIMNPPFASGAKHALKAWNMLWEGEIVAILNAETIRNPFSAERKQLVALIQRHGAVEFVADAFKGSEVDREAEVEVALVHLRKPAQCTEDWIGPVIDSMRVDRSDEDVFRLPNELALPASFVENQCLAFRAAVKAMREAVCARAVADHFAARIGKTMAEHQGQLQGEAVADVGSRVRKQLRTEYMALKDRAWTSVLRSTEAMSKLSRKIQQQAEASFNDIKALEFCESNVHSFLLGLVLSQPEMQVSMCLDLFDTITSSSGDNVVFYRRWKSNEKHRQSGWRIRTTRFILPGHHGYSSSLKYESTQLLSDLDKVFAMLDGKQAPEIGLVDIFSKRFSDLRNGERVSSSYFDARYYPMAGTIHFFARDKRLVDRLNKIVGAKRAWIPPQSANGTEAFWKQFDSAEKLDTEVRQAIIAERRKQLGSGYISRWDDPVRDALSKEREGKESAENVVAAALDTVLAKHGLLEALTHCEDGGQAQLPLLAA